MMEASRACFWTACALGGGSLAFMQWLATSDLPRKGAEERVKMVMGSFLRYLRITPGFDQFIKGFEVDQMLPEGVVRGTIAAEGALLSKAGGLHVGGLLLLIDCISSMTVVAAQRPGGVSLEIGATILSRAAAAGERLTVEARALRIGRTVAFLSVEIRRTPPAGGRSAGEGELVAVGTQTQHIGQPWLVRVMHALGMRFLPLARWFEQRRLGTLEGWNLPKCEATCMEEALPLQEVDGDEGLRFRCPVALHLLNGRGAGHGAASAALLAEAVRKHLAKKGFPSAEVVDMALSYPLPVPYRHDKARPAEVDIAVVPLPPAASAGAGADRRFLAELRSKDGKLLVRARIAAREAAAAAK